MKTPAFAAALLLVAGPALAQGVAPSGAVFGQNWQMGQDLDHLQNTAPAPTGVARQSPQQRRQNRAITGTGRPVAAMPPTTPFGGPEVAPPAPLRTPPATRPAPGRPSRVTADPPLLPVAPGQVSAPPTAAAPVAPVGGPAAPRGAANIPTVPGQSTGAARGTPASR